MAQASNSLKSPVVSSLWGRGWYFFFYGCLFIISLGVLSLGENIPEYTWGIAWIILCLGLAVRLPLVSIAACIPFLACLCLWVSSSSMEEAHSQFSFRKNPESLTGVIESVSGIQSGQLKVFLKTENFILSVKIPPQRESLLWNTLRFNWVQWEPGTKADWARGRIGSISYSSFETISTDAPLRLHFKKFLLKKIEELLPEPHSTLLSWILIGDASRIDDWFRWLYRDIGLSHITVVSGSNIAFVLSICGYIYRWVPKRWRLILSIGTVVSYVSLVGGDVPVLRAAIMGIIGAIALHGSKRIDTLRVLLFAAIVLLIFSPYSLVYDAGFQLSFLATLGILVGIRATKRADWFLQATVLSIFAALWTIPVSIGIFQNFSPWSILANILVWPVVGMAMLSGALALCFTWVAPVSYAIGHFCYFWLAWIQAVASWLGELSPRYTFESEESYYIALASVGIIVWLSLRYLYQWHKSDEASSPSVQR